MQITLTNAQRLALIHAAKHGQRARREDYTEKEAKDTNDGIWYLMHPQRR